MFRSMTEIPINNTEGKLNVADNYKVKRRICFRKFELDKLDIDCDNLK